MLPRLTVVATCLLHVVLTASTGRQCFTPGKQAQEGRCVALRNCTDLYIQLPTRPRTKEIDLYMRNIAAACSDVAGHSEGQEICCTYLGPKPTTRKPKKIIWPTRPPPLPLPRPPPPAVLPGHRCLSLLPSTQLCEQIISGLVFHANVSRRGEHPWMALLSRMRKANGEPVFDCTGSLISHRHVLTAAHCISGGLPILVRLGEYDLRQDPDCGGETTCSSYKDVGVQEMIPHEQYWSPTWESGRLRHDIALITLAEDVVFNAFIKPICLPPPKVAAMSLENRQFKIAGWGDTIASNGSKGTPSPVLLEGTVTVMSDDTCAARHQNFSGSKHTDSWPDVRTQVCALGKDGVDSCRGDSGGPLVYLSRESNVIVGLVSAGSSLCGVNNSALPGVYTRVAPYIEWILDHMCTPQ